MGLKNLAADETIQQMSEETQIDEITVQVRKSYQTSRPTASA
jgi:hypothetical protein